MQTCFPLQWLCMKATAMNPTKTISGNKAKMKTYLYNSLMTVTGLTPIIGYENAAKVVHLAHTEDVTLKEACLKLGYLDEKTFDESFHPERMV